MRRPTWSFFLCASLATWAGGPGPLARDATALAIAEPSFHEPQVLVATSNPPQFEIVFTREMPTTGWSFAVDDVDVDAASGRIVAKLTEIGPEGMVAQVITSTRCRVPLGKLTDGVYLLELWVRRGTDQPHALAQALVVRAR